MDLLAFITGAGFIILIAYVFFRVREIKSQLKKTILRNLK